MLKVPAFQCLSSPRSKHQYTRGVDTLSGGSPDREGRRATLRRPVRKKDLSELYPHYIEFRHVYKTFDHPVLVDCSFYVDPGETVAIIGRSGVGKSVTLSHIMGFLKPDKGRVIVDHQDITSSTEAELRQIRKKVTMVFQSGALFDSLTVGENILFSLELRQDYDLQNKEDVVRGLLGMVGLEEARLTCIRASCPPATSGRWPSLARWPRSRNASCTTSPQPWWTRSCPTIWSNLMLRLKDQLRLTSVVVTHDLELMRQVADRVVVLHQGSGGVFRSRQRDWTESRTRTSGSSCRWTGWRSSGGAAAVRMLQSPQHAECAVALGILHEVKGFPLAAERSDVKFLAAVGAEKHHIEVAFFVPQNPILKFLAVGLPAVFTRFAQFSDDGVVIVRLSSARGRTGRGRLQRRSVAARPCCLARPPGKRTPTPATTRAADQLADFQFGAGLSPPDRRRQFRRGELLVRRRHGRTGFAATGHRQHPAFMRPDASRLVLQFPVKSDNHYRFVNAGDLAQKPPWNPDFRSIFGVSSPALRSRSPSETSTRCARWQDIGWVK